MTSDKTVQRFTITASSYIHSGLSAIPTLADKRPACAWKEFTRRRMTDREIDALFAKANGIGIVCGGVSGNLELLDFDDCGSQFQPWFDRLPVFLQRRLVIESTPSGGRHVYYRVNDQGQPVPGNRKLAMKADGHVLIETRGEGGYVKCAPSEGYVLIQGDFLHIQNVSPFEQQILIDYAVALDQTRTAAKQTEKKTEQKAEVTPASTLVLPPSPVDVARMCAALSAAGWKKVRETGVESHWERPGKDERSTSATFNGEVFYVFSSNAAPFEPNRGYSVRNVLRKLGLAQTDTPPTPREANPHIAISGSVDQSNCSTSSLQPHTANTSAAPSKEVSDPGPLPEALLHVPGFVDLLTDHTLATAPYPNRPLAFAGALTMLAHLTGRNFRDPRNLRTNLYLLALADSGVGKDYPRKVNMNLATEVGIMPTMADRFASAEGLEDALLVHPASFFQVDEVDTLFAALNEKKDTAIEKIYGALLQFATSSDTTYAMRKKAIQQTGGKAGKFDKIRAMGIREPHLTMLGCAIPKYLYSALSERAMENGLLSRCLILEAGARGKAGNPHSAPFDPALLAMAHSLVAHGGFEGLDLDNLEEVVIRHPEPMTVSETDEAREHHDAVTRRCEELYDAADSQAEKALWTRGAEKAARLALLYAVSENVDEPLITPAAVDWGWAVVEHLTRRMLYQASVYVHDNEFDALRQKAMRYLRDYGRNGSLNHGQLLKRMHIDADSFRRVIDTLLQSELITAEPYGKGGLVYTLHDSQ